MVGSLGECHSLKSHCAASMIGIEVVWTALMLTLRMRFIQ